MDKRLKAHGQEFIQESKIDAQDQTCGNHESRVGQCLLLGGPGDFFEFIADVQEIAGHRIFCETKHRRF